MLKNHAFWLVSIHAPRVGRDVRDAARNARRTRFNPRAPCGARQTVGRGKVIMQAFQSTRPVWGATRPSSHPHDKTDVSIHAPRVGRDNAKLILSRSPRCFNPRAPCGARQSVRLSGVQDCVFQSTRPVWGATHNARRTADLCVVSIHAPRVGRDVWSCPCHARRRRFNPRAPCGARLVRDINFAVACGVSIHAPRVGRDPLRSSTPSTMRSFNPRAPCGARPYWVKSEEEQECFNPRAPCGARLQQTHKFSNRQVSIHAPRVGRD